MIHVIKSLSKRHLPNYTDYNPLSQYLKAQILAIGDEVKQAAAPILALKQRIKMQGLKLNNKKGLEGLIKGIKNEIVGLRDENEKRQKDDQLICVFEEYHIQKLPSSYDMAGGVAGGAVLGELQ